MKKTISSLFVIMLWATLLYAQDEHTFPETDRNETSTLKEYHSVAVKAGIFDIVSGLYGAHLESELNANFSVQGGGGITWRNFAQSLVAEMFENTTHESANDIPNGYDIEDSYYDYESRKATQGYFYAVQPKFYLEGDGFEGGYIGLSFQQRRYNFLAQNVDNTSSSIMYVDGNDIKEFEKQTIIAFTWGNQIKGDEAIFDYGLGLGFRNISGERRDLWLVEDGFSGEQNVHAYINKVKESQFYFEMSLKIGMYWSR